jgi:hypothetical protein
MLLFTHYVRKNMKVYCLKNPYSLSSSNLIDDRTELISMLRIGTEENYHKAYKLHRHHVNGTSIVNRLKR